MKSQKDSPPPHPGAILREKVLPGIGLTKSAVARRLQISRTLLYGLLGERYSVTPEMALKLSRLCRNRPEFWLNLQRDYDLWHAARSLEIKAREQHVDAGAAA
ncbi:addiction module HigA family antidote [Rhodoligotrophos appendicifer]|uniref:HigA family addiction module antitoxin n=1 Tax=Rhodoligotrophos appendicifer TaxID=987056 RepID=UPI0011866274|nr:HigA family addiction module antitoxin [Rhodoligotrophos appendicifer]